MEIRIARTAEEIETVRRFRYDIYVEELGRYGGRADHDRRRLADPEDVWSWVWYAAEGDEVIASVRITWGGHGFSNRQISQYRLAPFLAEVPHGRLAVGERLMIKPSRRGGDALDQLRTAIEPFQRQHGVAVVFGACEPHLLSMYCGLDQPRPYAERNINHPDAGYLIPTITVLDDAHELFGGKVPGCLVGALASTGTVRSPLLEDSGRFHTELATAIAASSPLVFDGLTANEIADCTARSSIVITCAEGDRVLPRGNVARNIYVVLEGALEVLDGEECVALLGPGDVFGETAFLLRCPRTFDVDVLEDGTRVLAISERTLRGLTDSSPTAAAKLFANLARVLSSRLASAR